ncbi:MAG: response regulator transcription factor [Janthinobacterium lividum]
MIRLFLVDDHTVVREALHMLFAQEPGLCVVGEAANGQQLLDQLPTNPADVVLLDMNMPVLDGIATARQLRLDFPAVRILMLSMVDEALQVGQAMTAGAHGYILKNANKAEIMTGIHTVLAGQRFLCSEVGLAMLDAVLGTSLPPVASSPLSRRELEVLQLVADGLTTQQIADKLFTSKRTVETQRQSMLGKVGVKNTAALVSYANAYQLLTMPTAKSFGG